MENSKKTCVFCLKSNDEKTCGKIYVKSGVAAHYFCMLFASGLCQNGKTEKDGILGFLPCDILKEAKRGTRLRCIYCKKPGATIGCVIRNCRASFHLPCGRTQGSMHQFFGTFCSYCPSHYIRQDVPGSDDKNVICSICIDTVTPAPVFESLRAPCCSKNWYHRECIQNSASSAGIHFFKCPLCNNKDEFQNEMLKMGIYIPDQDASWEKEPNAFQELLQRYNQCDATDCKCEQGRQYSKDEGKWKIILCDFCGSQGSHRYCKHLVRVGVDRICPDCKEIDHKGSECYSSDSDFSPLKKSSLDSCSSPETSKASSSYPGPSYSLKKKGLPKLTDDKNHKKSKKRKLQDTDDNNASKKHKSKKTATVCYAECNSQDQSASSSTLSQSSSLLGPKKRGRKKKSERPWLQCSQSILRQWLKSNKIKSTPKNCSSSPMDSSSSTQELVYRSSPRKNKPIVMKWEGKEVLIKSPRVVLHRNRIYSKQVTNPGNLDIDMNDGKIGSSWKQEVELLTNIDSEQRVTRNMIDIDSSTNVASTNGKKKLDFEASKIKPVSGSGSKVKVKSNRKSLLEEIKDDAGNEISLNRGENDCKESLDIEAKKRKSVSGSGSKVKAKSSKKSLFEHTKDEVNNETSINIGASNSEEKFDSYTDIEGNKIKPVASSGSKVKVKSNRKSTIEQTVEIENVISTNIVASNSEEKLETDIDRNKIKPVSGNGFKVKVKSNRKSIHEQTLLEVNNETTKNVATTDDKEKLNNEGKTKKPTSSSGIKLKVKSHKKSLYVHTKGEIRNEISLNIGTNNDKELDILVNKMKLSCSGTKLKVKSDKKRLYEQTKSEDKNENIKNDLTHDKSVKNSSKTLSGQKEKIVKRNSSQRKLDFPILSPLKTCCAIVSVPAKVGTSPNVKKAKDSKHSAVSSSSPKENSNKKMKSLSLDSITNYFTKSDTASKSNESEKKQSLNTKCAEATDVSCLDTSEGPLDLRNKPITSISPIKDQDSLTKTRKSLLINIGKHTPGSDSSIKNSSTSSDLQDSPAKNLRPRKLQYEPEKSDKVNPLLDSVVNEKNDKSEPAVNLGVKSPQKSGLGKPTSDVDSEEHVQVAMATEPESSDVITLDDDLDDDPDDVIPLVLSLDESLDSPKSARLEEKNALYWHFEGTRQVAEDSPSHPLSKNKVQSTKVWHPPNELVTLEESTSPRKKSDLDKTGNFEILKLLDAKRSSTSSMKKTPTTRQRTSRWDIGPGGNRIINNQNVCPSEVDNFADDLVLSHFAKSLDTSTFSQLCETLSPHGESLVSASSPVSLKSKKLLDDSPLCKTGSITPNVLKSVNKHTTSGSGSKLRNNSRLCYKRQSEVTPGSISDKDIMAEYYKSPLSSTKGSNSIDINDDIMKFLPLNH